MSNQLEWRDAQYRRALNELRTALDDFRHGLTNGLLTLEDLDALDDVVQAKKARVKTLMSNRKLKSMDADNDTH